jgi:hypothetical protein
VQESHKQRLATNTEGGKAPESRVNQLAETVESLRGQHDDAQKILKSSSRVVRRRIKHYNPSRGTLATYVNKLTEYFMEHLGPDWLNIGKTMGEEGGEEPADPSKGAYPTKVIGAFLRKYSNNLEVDEMLRGSVMRKIEEGIIESISNHKDDISAEVLIIQTDISTRGYQKVVTSTVLQQYIA